MVAWWTSWPPQPLRMGPEGLGVMNGQRRPGSQKLHRLWGHRVYPAVESNTVLGPAWAGEGFNPGFSAPGGEEASAHLMCLGWWGAGAGHGGTHAGGSPAVTFNLTRKGCPVPSPEGRFYLPKSDASTTCRALQTRPTSYADDLPHCAPSLSLLLTTALLRLEGSLKLCAVFYQENPPIPSHP